jgi:2-amino-4-hydroxy-6-hydroxymethyldihydropteridine diphosphokinase
MAIYVGLGSNLGERADTLARALLALEERGVEVEARSSLYESTPVGVPSRNAFLNAVVRVTTALDPHSLLGALLEVERGLGRRRDHPDGDRTCDLDLLLVGGAVVRDAVLDLPHPRIRQRRFVLLPLLELDAALRDPRTGAAYSLDAARLADDPAQRCVVAGRFPMYPGPGPEEEEP